MTCFRRSTYAYDAPEGHSLGVVTTDVPMWILSVSDPLCGVFMWMATGLQRVTAEVLYVLRGPHAVVPLTAKQSELC